ncbi:MAG: phage tail protein [Aurantibacter sp.]
MSDSPELNFHFKVEWGGTNLGFSEVTGLDFETEIIEYRHGMEPDYTKTKQPGLTKYSNVTLKRGTFHGDNEYYEWWKTIFSEDFRRDMTISLLDENHEPTVTWKLVRAWPAKIQSTDLKADGNEVAIESMEVAHEGLIIENE